jgi:hypothetical protein
MTFDPHDPELLAAEDALFRDDEARREAMLDAEEAAEQALRDDEQAEHERDAYMVPPPQEEPRTQLYDWAQDEEPF